MANTPEDPATEPTLVSEVVVNGSPTPGSVQLVDTPPIIDEPVVDFPSVPASSIISDPPYFSTGSSVGLQGSILSTQAQPTAQDQANASAQGDWRVKLSLASGSTYLYNDPNPGILAPLGATSGVIFPYTPVISVSYAANYDITNIIHSNYKIYQYSNSSVDQVNITCDFTCQDTYEANYLLAVIHFFRTMTKMFYGQDQNPKAGTPPPLCFMTGLGSYQFSEHPLAIAGFTYSLPNDVDYISTVAATAAGAQQSIASGFTSSYSTPIDSSITNIRLTGTGLIPGGTNTPATFPPDSNPTVTWVPTKIQLSISCIPIISRNQVSSTFSLKDYASGVLLNGAARSSGGMW